MAAEWPISDEIICDLRHLSGFFLIYWQFGCSGMLWHALGCSEMLWDAVGISGWLLNGQFLMKLLTI